MKALLITAILFAAAPLAAQQPNPEQAAEKPSPEAIEVMNGAHAFFGALRSADKTALARHMIPDGMIFVHNRMEPEAPRVDAVLVVDHLKRWEKSPRDVVEWMKFDTVLLDGDMAQVWGPYYFTVAGKLSHCGINSLSLVKTANGWKVANTSFTMEVPEKCDGIVRRIDGATMKTEPVRP